MKVLMLSAVLVFAGLAQARADDCLAVDPVYPEHLYPRVRLVTSHGDIVLELNRRRAPITVNNFLRYLKDGAFHNTIFHRVVPGFVVQGGGYGPDFASVETHDPIFNESGSGLKNQARTVAMARHDDPNTATSQFYFNLADNDSLDPGRRNWGYSVFGNVVEGWDVVEAIGAVETGYADAIGATDVPVVPVVLKQVELLPNEF